MSSLQCPATLLLARHGEAEYEATTWADEGGSLTTRGRAQAAALAERVADRRVVHVWTSTLARAVQTGDIVAARLGVGVTTRVALSEFAVADLAGAPLDTDPFATSYDAWLAGDLEPRVPGGESGTELVARARDVLGEIADLHPGETVLVVSHGGLLYLAVTALGHMDATPARLGNCDLIEVAVDADGWACTAWG